MAVFDNNRALLDAFRRGDRDALERVYYAYVDEVAMLVRRGFAVSATSTAFVQGATDAAIQCELVQEVFTRAFAERARNAYDGVRPYRPYLLRIVRNLMIDRARAKTRDKARLVPSGIDIDEVIESNAAIEAPAPEDALYSESLHAATRVFLDGCDEETRRFVALRFEDELSQIQVAERMGITRRRVRTVERRVMKQLRRHLQREGLS